MQIPSVDTFSTLGPVRKSNQDSFWVGKFEVNSGCQMLAAILADGMGGLADGEFASQTICSKIKEGVQMGVATIEGFAEKFREANQMVLNHANSINSPCGSTGTFVLLNLENGYWESLHVGDSRLYTYTYNPSLSEITTGSLSGEGYYDVQKITQDHTGYEKYLVESPERLNSMSSTEKNRLRSSLTRCIGASENLILDQSHGKLHKKDSLLLASDGFWHGVESRKEFASIGKKSLDMFASDNITLSGETDNQTAVHIKIS